MYQTILFEGSKNIRQKWLLNTWNVLNSGGTSNGFFDQRHVPFNGEHPSKTLMAFV